MFEGFANVWTPVTLARRLKGRGPLAATITGEKVVFFRDGAGKVSALLDRCPHRGVALSLGKVTGAGCLECPFHAWQFDGAGAAVHVPLNPDAKRERLFATALPAREIGGLLWLYTAPTDHPEPAEPVVAESLTRGDLARTFIEVEWAAHWTRAMENMLDSPHVPFVHATTIGRFVRPRLRPTSTMHVSWEDTPYGGRTTSWLDGDDVAEQQRAYLDFYRPNVMVLNIPVPKQVFRMHAICVPVDAGRVRMLVVGARSFARLRLLDPFFNASNMKIVKQDQAVVESSFPVEVPPAADEVSVRTDRATLQFRRYYYDVLKPSSAPPRRHLKVA